MKLFLAKIFEAGDSLTSEYHLVYAEDQTEAEKRLDEKLLEKAKLEGPLYEGKIQQEL